jgi:NMD protein affecting ribosome stability and mRNA decay
MKQKLRVCHNCGATRHVRRGLCRSCRKRALGTGEPVPEVTERPPARPDLEPPHGRPWVHRGSGSR